MTFMTITLGDIIGSGIASAIVGALLAQRIKRVESGVEEEFRRREDRDEYLRQALFELFGPVKMELMRTKRAFLRWNDRSAYIETQVIRAGNLRIRDLLLTKGHLIPGDLIDEAQVLIEHYDVWLEEYELARGNSSKSDSSPRFVFAGPKGFRFPHEAEGAFIKRSNELQQELYGARAV